MNIMSGTNEEYKRKIDLLVAYNELYEENTKLKQDKEELQEQIIALNTVVSCVKRNDLKIDKIKEYCETIKEKYKFFHKSMTTDVSAILEIIGGNDDK